jgi:2-polyprenylphenol 6-hydroxylase
MNQPVDVDVLVIGGGIVGLTAAIAMGARNYSVGVLDAGVLHVDEVISNTRVYAINSSSKQLLQELHVWQHLKASSSAPFNAMHVWDSTTDAAIDFNARDIAAPMLGTIVTESALKQALLNTIATYPNIRLWPNCPIDAIHRESEMMHVSNQEGVWQSSLLMIADGAQSAARTLLGVSVTTWPYNHHALVATVNTTKPHDNTAWQVFHPDGPLAFLPLSTTHQCSIVWSTEPKKVQYLMQLPEEAFNNEVSIAFGHRLGDVSLASTRHQFPLHMRHVKEYVGPHWLFLGDAAHTIHPLAGLGLNLGFADIRSFISQLETPGSYFAPKKLRAYQRQRKHAVWQSIILMEALKRLFSHTTAPLPAIRGVALKLCNQLTLIKRLMMEHVG